MVNQGGVPAFQISPSSPMFQTMMSLAAVGCRPTFTDFPALLRKYIDFDEIAAWARA
jgi:hypothetical protein